MANPKNLKIEPKEIQKIKDIYEKFRKSKKDPEHPNDPKAAQKSQKSSLQSMSNMGKIFRMHTTCIYPAWMACERYFWRAQPGDPGAHSVHYGVNIDVTKISHSWFEVKKTKQIIFGCSF